MKLEINTTKKTITILEETPLLEVLAFIQQFNTDGYKIVSKESNDKIQVIQLTRVIPNEYNYDPYNPYKITC